MAGRWAGLAIDPHREHDPQHWQRVEQWFESELGQALLAEEDRLIKSHLDTCYGHYQLTLSACQTDALPEHGKISRRFRLGNACHLKAGQSLDAVCELEQLPVDTESQDVVVLRHLLELCDHPHLLLREVERVMAPRGRLLITGINPLSIVGLRCLLGRLHQPTALNNRLLMPYRIKDWLAFMGFEVECTHYAFRRALAGGGEYRREPARLGLWKRLPFGGIYTLSAIKQRHAVRPLRPQWRQPALGNVIPIAAARSMQRLSQRTGEV